MNLQEYDIQRIQIGTRYRRDLGADGVDWNAFVQSIKDKGIIQPITITKKGLLVAGERRLKAAKEAGLDTVPVIIREESADELDLREVELAENLFRKDLIWSERATLQKRIFDLMKEKDPKWSLRKQAELGDEAKTSIARQLKLADALDILPELLECKDEATAFKRLHKLEERMIIDELSKRVSEKTSQARKWADDHYKIGDALIGLSKVQAGVVQFLEVDPPYGVDLGSVKNKNKTNTAETYIEIDRKKYPDFLSRLCPLLYRTLADNSFCVFWYGMSWHEQTRDALRGAGFKVADIPSLWYKGALGQTSSPDTFLGNSYEPFWVARKGQPKIRKAGRSNVFDFSPLTSSEKIHPTEKPIELMHEILDTFCYPAQTLCSPFLGSGAVLIAAYNRQMSGFGWDLNPEYKKAFLQKARVNVVVPEVERAQTEIDRGSGKKRNGKDA